MQDFQSSHYNSNAIQLSVTNYDSESLIWRPQVVS